MPEWPHSTSVYASWCGFWAPQRPGSMHWFIRSRHASISSSPVRGAGAAALRKGCGPPEEGRRLPAAAGCRTRRQDCRRVRRLLAASWAAHPGQSLCAAWAGISACAEVRFQSSTSTRVCQLSTCTCELSFEHLHMCVCVCQLSTCTRVWVLCARVCSVYPNACLGAGSGAFDPNACPY